MSSSSVKKGLEGDVDTIWRDVGQAAYAKDHEHFMVYLD
jgi:hypothetical protein